MAKAKAVPLTLAAIQAVRDVRDAVDVPVPEWGGSVIIRGLTRGEVKSIRTDARNGDGRLDEELSDAMAVAAALVDPPVTLEQARDLLAAKGVPATERILTAILELSGLAPDGVGATFRPGQAS